MILGGRVLVELHYHVFYNHVTEHENDAKIELII